MAYLNYDQTVIIFINKNLICNIFYTYKDRGGSICTNTNVGILSQVITIEVIIDQTEDIVALCLEWSK